MGNVTVDFSSWEWACRCGCGQDNLHPTIIQRNQDIRTRTGRRFDYTSGCRCDLHNKNEGGGAFSFHKIQKNGYCAAGDWIIEGMGLREMYLEALKVPEYRSGGIGVYFDEKGPRIHSDVRRTGAYHWGFLNGLYVPIETVLKAYEAEGKKENEPIPENGTVPEMVSGP